MPLTMTMSMVVSTMPPTTRVATMVTNRDYHLSPTITMLPSTKSGTMSTMTVPENTTMALQMSMVVSPLITPSHFSPTMTTSSSMKLGTNAWHDSARKYHHAAAEGGYHHESMNKMIKKTSETLSNRLQYTQMNYPIRYNNELFIYGSTHY
jgi:hypothetical protein